MIEKKILGVIKYTKGNASLKRKKKLSLTLLIKKEPKKSTGLLDRRTLQGIGTEFGRAGGAKNVAHVLSQFFHALPLPPVYRKRA